MAYSRASRFRAGRCGREARRHRLSAEFARFLRLVERGDCIVINVRLDARIHESDCISSQFRSYNRLSGNYRENGVLSGWATIRYYGPTSTTVETVRDDTTWHEERRKIPLLDTWVLAGYCF